MVLHATSPAPPAARTAPGANRSEQNDPGRGTPKAHGCSSNSLIFRHHASQIPVFAPFRVESFQDLHLVFTAKGSDADGDINLGHNRVNPEMLPA